MPERPAEYRLTPEAERDLESIWLHTFAEWGLSQAERYADELIGAFARLAASPGLGQACVDIRSGYRRHVVGRHVLYFRVTSYGIAVIRILHDRMLPARHL